MRVLTLAPVPRPIHQNSITEVGDFVARDEPIAIIETDKVDVTVNSPESGTVLELCAKEGETIEVGSDLFKIELGGAPNAGELSPFFLSSAFRKTRDEFYY